MSGKGVWPCFLKYLTCHYLVEKTSSMHENYIKYNIQCCMVFYVNMVTSWMILLMEQILSRMMDEFMHWPKPCLLVSGPLLLVPPPPWGTWLRRKWMQWKRTLTKQRHLVRDNLKLPDNGGEIPKSQGRGWRFESCCKISSLHDKKLVRWSTA